MSMNSQSIKKLLLFFFFFFWSFLLLLFVYDIFTLTKQTTIYQYTTKIWFDIFHKHLL